MKYLYSIIFLSFLFSPQVIFAQEVLDDTQPQISDQEVISEMLNRASEVDGALKPTGNFSIFFTPRELALIENAREGVVARLATDTELRDAQNEQSVPKGPREIGVGGILYLNPNDWAIWINNQKITPERIPSEIMDISVGKDYVRLKWYDAYTNQIFPIKLKTYQRFNLDTRIFLPG